MLLIYSSHFGVLKLINLLTSCLFSSFIYLVIFAYLETRLPNKESIFGIQKSQRTRLLFLEPWWRRSRMGKILDAAEGAFARYRSDDPTPGTDICVCAR